MSEHKLKGENLIDEHEAARIIGNTVRTLQSWRGTGKGPDFFKLGRCVRYSPAVVEAFLAERQSADELKRKATKIRKQKKLDLWAAFLTRNEHV